MEYYSKTIEELIKMSEINFEDEPEVLVLPNFQRDFVWERKINQKKLLTSVVYNMPVGSLLILKGQENFFAKKKLCYMKEIKEKIDRSNVLYLLDGQQRIATLKSMFYDFFEPNKREEEKIYPKLKTRWFLRIKPNSNLENGLSKEDIFGWENLAFSNVNLINEYEPIDIFNIIEHVIPNKQDWHHPEYKKEQWTKVENGNDVVLNNKRKLLMAKESAEYGLVPLFDLCNFNVNSKSDKLHYKALSVIANNRKEELKAEVQDGRRRIKDVLHKYLTDSDYNDEDAENAINSSWDDLERDWIENVYDFIDSIKKKEIPVIELKESEMSRAIYTFEYINRGGTPLSLYDLIVAKAAHDRQQEKQLTERIKDYLYEDKKLPGELTINLKEVSSEYWKPNTVKLIEKEQIEDRIKRQYLHLLTIFSRCKYEDLSMLKADHGKRAEQLKLTTSEINSNTELTISSLLRAYAFLHFRCGICDINDLNYQLMIIPIAYALRNNNFWHNKNSLDKVEYWYWSSLFSGSYKKRQNEQCVFDTEHLYGWLLDQISNPFEEREKRVLRDYGYSDEETLMLKGTENGGSIESAIKNGLLQYIISTQPKDFFDDRIILSSWKIAEGKEIELKNRIIKYNETEIHHIIPLGSSNELFSDGVKKIEADHRHILNSPLNKTRITKVANNDIRDKKIEYYFEHVSNVSKDDHIIPDFSELGSDIGEKSEKYEKFLKKRYEKFKTAISKELSNLKLD